jgi:hypothetical protein
VIATGIFNLFGNSSNKLKRNRAQEGDPSFFQAISDRILQRNPSKNLTKSFNQYNRETLDTYAQSPLNNLDNIREISRFLTRVSMPYKLMLQYYASMYEYRYNIIPLTDLTKSMSNK